MIDNMKAVQIVRERRVVKEGCFAETVIWQVPQPVPPCTHLYKYRLVYIVDGRRAVGFDNERGKGDHYHVDEEEFAYVFTGIAQLLMDFDMEVARYGNGYCDS